MKKISILVPVFNESEGIYKFHNSLNLYLDKIKKYNFVIWYIDDGSDQATKKALKKIKSNKRQIRIIELSRNYGKEVAIFAALENISSSDACIILDSDLQHPPKYIKNMLIKFHEGYEVIIGRRVSNDDQGIARKISSTIFSYLATIANTKFSSNLTDFVLIGKMSIKELRNNNEKNKNFKLSVIGLEYKKYFFDFSAPKRLFGKTQYSFSKLVNLAITTLFLHSSKPLKFIFFVGSLISLLSFFMLSMVFMYTYVNETGIFTPLSLLVVANIFLSGVVILFIGFLAIYIDLLLKEVIDKPYYHISKIYK